MADLLHDRILEHLQSDQYRPKQAQGLARDLGAHDDSAYPSFRQALRELMHAGRVMLGSGGTIVLPTASLAKNQFVGTYRHNQRGFGFVVPTDSTSREDLFIPPGENGGALTGDVVVTMITNREQRDGKDFFRGRVLDILERGQKRFVGSLSKIAGEWVVVPDGNTMTAPILAPDAGSRHIRAGTKVVIEITSYAEDGGKAQGVITEVLGQAGEKDVDLKTVIIHHNLPLEFPPEVLAEARAAVDNFNPEAEKANRFDLSDEIVCTIDPDDAKDYDDAISLRQLDNGLWELGVHIADVSHFVPAGSALDEEAKKRGNSCYFPGHVIPMLPEILSNGVCSLQEGVPRLCKSAFITYDDDARPISAKFANTIIHSRKRLRYREAQAILDGAKEIPHPDGAKTIKDYEPEVLSLLRDMNALARRLHKRRQEQGQIVLELPEVDLILNEDGKVVDAVPEDQSFTHTLIEMFMVEGNEAVARLLDSQKVPFIRRVHPEPEMQDSSRLKKFAEVTGHQIGKEFDRKALQQLLAKVKGQPESYAINLAVLKSLTRAEYSPEVVGHYALASEHYAHFTSPIRRYADLTIHRLLDSYIEARELAAKSGGKRKRKLEMTNVISFDDLVNLGKQISYTERRAADAERELRQIKILELLQNHVGEEFMGVITGIANFGIFVQLNTWLADGLIRYEDLMDDWWDVDTQLGQVRGQRTGKVLRIGDLAKVVIVRVDLARRELILAISEHLGKPGAPRQKDQPRGGGKSRSGGSGRGKPAGASRGKSAPRGGSPPRNQRGGSPPRNQRGPKRGKKR